MNETAQVYDSSLIVTRWCIFPSLKLLSLSVLTHKMTWLDQISITLEIVKLNNYIEVRAAYSFREQQEYFDLKQNTFSCFQEYI